MAVWLLAVLCGPAMAAAEQADPFAEVFQSDPDAQMLLEADRLVYDFDNEIVEAIGQVEIYYIDYVVTADRVTYFQVSRRLVASGNVRILEPQGNIITAAEIDLTDNFRDGFVRSINILTTERARFAAQSAERRDGEITIFQRGVYTACEPCKDHPERPPFWQIKAATIIHDNRTQTVSYEDASLEFFGIPVAYWPYFFHADPRIKRKSGLLIPSIKARESLGVGVSVPVFFNLAPNYDITFTPTVYSRQGLHGDVEWRHRLMNGSYRIRGTGIFQADESAFVDETGKRLSGFRSARGSIQSDGQFAINSRWIWGWDVFASSDRAYGRDYSITRDAVKDVESSIYLTGISERNHFDARTLFYRVQRENTVETDVVTLTKTTHDDQKEQAFVIPVVDHNYIADQAILGGQVSIDSNLTALTRAESDVRVTPAVDYYAGVSGTSARLSSNAAWKRTIVAPGGQLLTPFAYLDVALNWGNFDDPAAGLTSDTLVGRAMPAVGLEYKWPILISSAAASQTISPVVQIIARPDERRVGQLPNDDSQGLVFDTTNLFSWDKFTGYDRQEGGTRANVGVTYQARLANGFGVDAVVGQSFQVSGTNSYALTGQALSGIQSGLDTRASDIVGRVTVDTGTGFAVTARGRLSDADLTVNRAELEATAVRGRSHAKVGYAFLRAQPAVGITSDREELSGEGTYAFNENWSVSGAAVFDVRKTGIVSHGIGIAYDNECFTLSVDYSQTRDRYTDQVDDKTLFVRFNLRTIGENGIRRHFKE